MYKTISYNFSWHHQMFEPRGVGEHASSGRKATLQSWQAVASDGISIILNMLCKDDELMTLAMTRIVRMTRAVAPVLAPGPKLRLRNLGSGQWSTQSLQHCCFTILPLATQVGITEFLFSSLNVRHLVLHNFATYLRSQNLRLKYPGRTWDQRFLQTFLDCWAGKSYRSCVNSSQIPFMGK